MNFQQVLPAKWFAISLERILRGKETKEHGGKKANYWLSSMASFFDKLVMRAEGQDTVKRTESSPT
jgi:hypothetical protein